MANTNGADRSPGARLKGALTSVRELVVGAVILVLIVVAYLVTSSMGLYSPFHGQSAPANEGSRTSEDPSADVDQAANVEQGFCQDPVDWRNAASVVGQEAFIEGPVVSVQAAQNEVGRPTFINIGADYPDPSRFTVVIWTEGRLAADFDPPDEAVMGPNDPEQVVCVVGQVTSYKGIPQIAMTGQSQMKVARPR